MLRGSGAIRTKTGQIIDAKTFQRIQKENGIGFSANEFLDTFDTHGRLDYELLLRQKRAAGENLKRGNVVSEFENLASGLRNKFENAYRSTFLAHRLKQELMRERLNRAVRCSVIF